jgi:predicted TIM-barrel fold metal-dependent hydrolase
VKTAFWFEQETVRRMAELYPDNVMVESDFPHPTCLEPGPTSSSGTVREVLTATLAGLPEDLCRKVLYENAAELYGVDVRTT